MKVADAETEELIESLQAEVKMLRDLLQHNRKGFMEMAMENFNLIVKIDKLENSE